MTTPNPWDLKSTLLEKIKNHGGFVNAHAHFDKSYTISIDKLPYSHASINEKWKINNEIKKGFTEKDLVERISRAIENMIGQGVSTVMTFADVDSETGLKHLKAIIIARDMYKNKITVLVANQITRGILDAGEQKIHEEAAELVDIIGGLADFEHPHEDKHIEFVLKLAKKHGKRAQIHIDQDNDPDQKVTEILAQKTIDIGVEGKVMGAHAVSLAAQDKKYRSSVIDLLKNSGVSIIVCPVGAISMRQLDKKAPSHNSIAPVVELIAAGVNVALGTDNIYDLYSPFGNGDMYKECEYLMDICRWWDLNSVAKIASINGRRALGISL